MFVGVIKTKDVLFHPMTLIRMRGFKGFVKLFFRALSPKKYRFIGMTQKTQWISIDDEISIENPTKKESP